MKNLSTYHLICELLSNGSGKLFPAIEPININNIIEELELRYGIRFSDQYKYAEWFLESDESSDSEKASIETMVQIKKIEKRALEKLESRSMGSDSIDT